MHDLLNCPNCGAPIEKDYCPYCGAVFLDWACFDIQKPTFVKIRDHMTGRISLMKLGVCSASERIEMRYCHCGIPNCTIEAEFKAVPFKHPLSDQEVLRIEIDEKEASPEILKDALKGLR